MTDLTAIKTPFGLLDRETQEALKAHGGPWEVYFYPGQWEPMPLPNWNNNLAYRVKPTPAAEVKLPEAEWEALLGLLKAVSEEQELAEDDAHTAAKLFAMIEKELQ